MKGDWSKGEEEEGGEEDLKGERREEERQLVGGHQKMIQRVDVVE